MAAAALRMADCMAAIRQEKAVRGIEQDAKIDILGTGMLGTSGSAITTTLGALEAKRTSATTDMAALCVRLLTDAGIMPGDTIGACFSGSFPALNIALLCAADSMHVSVIYTVSVGASTYGANQTAFTAPEMLIFLAQQGLLATAPAGITWGGEGDTGANMQAAYFEDEQPELDAIAARLNIAVFDSYEESFSWRTAMYGTIDGFVSVGGHVLAMGRDETGYSLGEGILKQKKINELTIKSGLLAHYMNAGCPTISMLNLRVLCQRYSLVFDPPLSPVIGVSAIYWQTAYSRPWIVATLLASLLLLIAYRFTLRKKH